MIDSSKWRVLLVRNFALLVAGRTGSGIGSSIFGIAALWWVLEHYGAAAAGMMSGATLVGTIVFRPLAGVVVDRVDRRRSLVLADICGAVVLSILVVSTLAGTLGIAHFVVAVVGTSITGAIVTPATRSLVPEILSDDQLTPGNSVLSSLSNVSSLAGPAAAGALLAVFSYETVFAINAVSYGVAAVAELLMSTTSDAAVTDDQDEFLTELREAFAYFGEQQRLKRMALAAASINFFGSPILLLGPALIEQYGYSAFYAGVTHTLFAVGALVAAGLLVFLDTSDSADVWEVEVFGGLSFVAVVFGVGGTAVLLSPETTLVVVLGTVLFVSIAASASDIRLDSIVQASVPEERQGRAFGLLKTIGNVTLPVSMSAAGFAIELVGARWVFVLMSLGVIASVALVGSTQVYALLTGNAVTADGRVISRDAAE